MNFDQNMLDKIRSARHVVVFTGAGVSQESGIPTFRDALSGLWENFDAEMLATPEAFAKDPDLVWGWYASRRSVVTQCQPNAAHHAIAALAKRVPRLTLVTQNVDDLHERAGSQDVIHLHGSLFRARCSGCGKDYPLEPSGWSARIEKQRIKPPACAHCGDLVRPDIVWFGEFLPEDEWQRAVDASSACDVFFCIGTSSLVRPAASLPYLATEHGASLIQINPMPTDLDRAADYVLSGKAGEVMGALEQSLLMTK